MALQGAAKLPGRLESGEQQTGPALDLGCLTELGAAPERRYLPDGSLEALSDSFASVEGRRLPLHSQVLSTQSAVLRELFVSAREAGGQAMPDLSAAFEGSSIEDTILLLRLVYCPQEACGSSFSVLAAAGRLEGVARLADKLDTPRLLRSLEHYLAGLAGRLAAQRGELQELLASLRVAHACRFAAPQDSCLEGVADHIAAAGSCWPPGLAEALEGFDSSVLTQLLRKTGLRSLGTIYRPSPLFDVRPEATDGATGGFHLLPGGLLHPPRHRSGRQLLTLGRACLDWDGKHAKHVRAVTFQFRIWVMDQRGAAGQDYEVTPYNRDTFIRDTFIRDAGSWARTRFMPLAELLRRDRAYLAHDRLILRVELSVQGTDAASD
ncbi:hypothetical protein ABPG77_002201 [Micractinium sp. CCAP 211/92]